MNPIVEIARITLGPGRTEADLVAASDASSPLADQPGFMRRELVRGEGGEFYDIVLWQSDADGAAVMEKAMSSAPCLAYFAVMDMENADASSGVRHLPVLASYG